VVHPVAPLSGLQCVQGFRVAAQGFVAFREQAVEALELVARRERRFAVFDGRSRVAEAVACAGQLRIECWIAGVCGRNLDGGCAR